MEIEGEFHSIHKSHGNWGANATFSPNFMEIRGRIRDSWAKIGDECHFCAELLNGEMDEKHDFVNKYGPIPAPLRKLTWPTAAPLSTSSAWPSASLLCVTSGKPPLCDLRMWRYILSAPPWNYWLGSLFHEEILCLGGCGFIFFFFFLALVSEIRRHSPSVKIAIVSKILRPSVENPTPECRISYTQVSKILCPSVEITLV